MKYIVLGVDVNMAGAIVFVGETEDYKEAEKMKKDYEKKRGRAIIVAEAEEKIKQSVEEIKPKEEKKSRRREKSQKEVETE